ncbi:MAG TPA: hypothetical protein PLM07_07625 [Candidatus Rifleibacterium sp.]|nr:hypothetical protein [Candidatus Rifleibacterium sp.]HPT45754.1 hypothetical protein [Candidatus Rifleibacterium sp.]
MNRRGFSLYLTFLVTTIVFILVTGSQQIGRTALDLGRSDAIEAVVFHAADGGLERGLAKLRRQYVPFSLNYVAKLGLYRELHVTVSGEKQKSGIDLKATAVLFEGSREVSRRSLLRNAVLDQPGRAGSGRFLEAS